MIVSIDTSREIETIPVEDELRLENQLIFAIYNNANKVARLLRPLLEPFGLTFPQYLALLALWGRPPSTVSDLSRALDLESNTLTPLLKRLEATGYVTRQRDRDDERRVRILLTPKGKDFRAEAAALRARVIRELAISEEDVATLKRTLRHLSQRIDALRDHAVPSQPSPVPAKRHADRDDED